MNNHHCYYEFPLNKRIRILIRLEQLFLQLDHFLLNATTWDRRAAIDTLLNILAIFSRNDLKSEILKELKRHSLIMVKMAESQDADASKVKQILNELNEISTVLYESNGKISPSVIQSNLFKSISQRNSVLGGLCSFDLPAFHYWLEQDENTQKDDLDKWMQPFATIHPAVNLILKLIRQSGLSKQEVALAGLFQLTIDKSSPHQLIRIKVKKTLPYFAEVSGGKHRLTVRFMDSPANGGRVTQTKKDVPFEITYCLF